MPKRKKKSTRTIKRETRERVQNLRSSEAFREEEQKVDSRRRRSARQNPEIQSQEQQANTLRRRSARKNPEVQSEEQQANTIRRRSVREIKEVRTEEQKKDTRRGRSVRENQEVRTAEQKKDTRRRRSVRENPEVRTEEQKKDTRRRRSVRAIPEVRSEEQQTNTTRRRSVRKNPEVRTEEQKKNTCRRRSGRENPEVRTEEQKKDTRRRRSGRENPDVRFEEQQENTIRRRSVRANPEVRTEEQKKNTIRRRSVRANPELRTEEQKKNTVRRRSVRINPEVSAGEQQSNTRRRRLVRETPKVRDLEQQANTRRRRAKRTVSETSEQEREANTKRRRQTRRAEADRILNLPFEGLSSLFHGEIRDTPSNICNCCGGLFYKKGVIKYSKKGLKDRGFRQDFIKEVIAIRADHFLLCRTCYTTIIQGKVPKLCLSNGHEFPPIPPELKELSPLEERMVSPRLPFMQLRNVGSEGQLKLKGNIINVENDLDVCARVIPRQFTEMSTIQVQLMRRMQYDRPYMHERIRPAKVYKASMYLKNTELYTENNVEVRDDYRDEEETATIEFIVGLPADSTQDEVQPQAQNNSHQDSNADSVALNEGEEEVDANTLDESLIYNECDYRVQGIRLAPGEGRTPIPIYDDPYCEEMSFPTIYCGRKKVFKCRMTYTSRAKSELRNRDRRACKPNHILYMFKRSHNEKLRHCVQVHLRKRRSSERIKASQARDPAFLKNLMDHDEGYSVFKTLRSSPSYWMGKQKKVLGMIRQIGKCTFFITLSAAETRWPELLVVLHKLLKGEDITEEEAMLLPPEDKADIIRSDPVTCMRHFDHRYKQFRKTILESPNGVFHPYSLFDHFSRVEFQMRGSPHSHGLYWVEGAPVYDEEIPGSELACIEFIDRFITCRRDVEGDMEDLLPYQIHNHSRSCMQGQGPIKECRFGFPKPPMPETVILTPLPNEFDPQALEFFQDLFKKIRDFLKERGRNPEECLSFQEFLHELDTTLEDYLMAVRSSISRSTVFLKRATDEAYINSYNKKILQTWRANIDVQFVLDTYACAKYCVGYITKAEGGISKTLQQITRMSKKQKLTYRELLKQYAGALINGTQISTQEASGFLLGLPNTSCSRSEIFVNTSPPDQRIRILRSSKELNSMEEDCEDVCASGVIEHYQQRPVHLENWCLADFATLFEFEKRAPAEDSDDDESQMTYDSVQSDAPGLKIPLLDGSGLIRPRKKRKILRFRNYGQNQDPENWAREQLMLFVPFRNEDAEINSINVIERVGQPDVKDVIIKNSTPYYHSRNLDDMSLQDLFNNISAYAVEEDDDAYDENAEETAAEVDAMIGGYVPRRIEGFMPPKCCSDEEYATLMQSLNDKQRKFALNVMHALKTSSEPFYYFLSGGAGTGKSHVINAIVQSIFRYSALFPTEHPEQVPVVVGAATGKAAFNVFGMTLHTLFRLLPIQSKKVKIPDLDAGTVSTLRFMLAACKCFIIDEISLVGVRQFYHISRRLQQVYGNNLFFGGKPVIVVGDLKQLPPFGARHIFKDPDHELVGDVLGNPLWEMFSLFELDEIMRQKGDWEFCKALNNMAVGCMDKADIDLIKSRQIQGNTKPPKDAIWLFRTNDECAEYNAKIHAQLEGNAITSTALDQIQGYGSTEDKVRLRESAKHFSLKESDGLPYETNLKVGGEYFVSTNIDVADGLFNGSTGTLELIETYIANDVTKIRRVWMLFKHFLVGEKARKAAEIKKLYDRPDVEISRSWVPISHYKRKLSKTYQNHSLSVVRIQIPLIACNGMTIAKSQGSSMTEVVVSVRNTLRRQELYVACSRATSKQGLYIDGVFKPPKKPAEDDAVTEELTRLRGNGFPFNIQFLQDFGPEYLKFYFHNIQSFRKHRNDLIADQCAMSADLICLVEPWLLDEDQANVPGYNVLHRVNCTSHRNSEGILVLVKESAIDFNVYESMVDIKHDKSHCIILHILSGPVDILAVYKSPQYSKAEFVGKLCQILEDAHDTIIVGDFNMDVTGELQQRLAAHGFELKTKGPTTNQNTTIDACFSNMNVDSWISESYYSYHKPICAVMKNEM